MVVIDLWPSQRETSEIGTPSASAVLAKVCRKSWNVASGSSSATASAGFPDFLVAIVAPQQSSPRGPAQHLALLKGHVADMTGDGVVQEARHGHVPHRRGGFRRREHGAAVHDDHLLADGDHPGRGVHLARGQAEGLALAEPGPAPVSAPGRTSSAYRGMASVKAGI